MRRFVLAMMMVVASAGCGEETEPSTGNETPELPDQDHVEPSGIALELVAIDSQGRSYRLRNADFIIQPYYYYYYGDGGVSAPQTVSTEANPSASRIEVRLLPGQYMVTLAGDWYLERLVGTAVERVQKVVLLSERTQYAYIADRSFVSLDFRFGVDGDLIDFRYGNLNIDISIEVPGDPRGFDAGYPYYPYPSHDAGTPAYDASVPSLDAATP
jgi:hypothetical protein